MLLNTRVWLVDWLAELKWGATHQQRSRLLVGSKAVGCRRQNYRRLELEKAASVVMIKLCSKCWAGR
jgi:hypothetical protein